MSPKVLFTNTMGATQNIVNITETELLCNRIGTGLLLVLTLFLGLRVKRAKTLKEYALAGRSLGTGAVLMTLAATLLSSRSFHMTKIFKRGSVIGLVPIAGCISIMVLGWFFFPKLLHFRKQNTFSGAMQQLYGTKTAQVTSLLAVLTGFFVILSQFSMVGQLSRILDISRVYFILIVGITITLYTFLGSMRSVAITDILQLICILGGTLAFVLFSLNNKSLEVKKESFFTQHPSFWDQDAPIGRYLVDPFFIGLFPTIVIMPPVIQRVLMLRSKKAVQTTFLGVSLIKLFFSGLIFLVAIHIAKCIDPKYVDTSVSIKNYLINRACGSPIGKFSFFLALLSILVSSVDSFLHSTAFELVAFWQRTRSQPIQEKKIVRSASYLTLVFGSLTTVVAVSLVNIRPEETFGYAILSYSVLVVPFLAGLCGLKGNDKTFGITILTYVFLLGFLPYVLDTDFVLRVLGKSDSKNVAYQLARFCWIPSILGSTLVYFVAHYLTYGHFAVVDREKNRFIKHHKHTLSFTWLKSPARWAREKAQQYGMRSYALGLFFYLTLMVPYLFPSGSAEEQMRTVTTIWVLRALGGLFVTAILLESLWSKRLHKRYFPLFYYLTIFFCVPFIATMTTLSDPNGRFSIPNIVLSITLLIVLVDWQTFLGFFALAFTLSTLLQKGIKGEFLPTFDKEQGLVLIASLLYSMLLCLVFARKKQLSSYLRSRRLTRSKERSEARLYVLETLHQQLVMTVDLRSSMMREAETIADKMAAGVSDKADGKKLKKVLEHLSAVQSKSLEDLPLEAEEISWNYFAQKLFQDVKDLELEEQVVFSDELRDDSPLWVVDVAYMQRLFVNAIQHITKYYPEGVAYCHVDEALLHYDMGGKAKEIPAYRIVVATKKVSLNTKRYNPSQAMPHLTKDVKHLSENYRITLAHYGNMGYVEDGDHCAQTYVVPQHVHLVRPKITTLVDEDLALATRITDSEDQDFLWVASDKGLHIPMIEKALRICKHYHRNQKRKSGEAYYLHPLAVATILLDYSNDDDIITAALLHDIIEDTPYTRHQIGASFNPEVARIVMEVSNIYSKESRKLKLAKKEKFKDMLNNSNPKSLLVKLADRLHNMRTLASQSREKQARIAQETLDFFVPIAQHLGHHGVEEELVALAQRYV